jgi:hypothetical protein
LPMIGIALLASARLGSCRMSARWRSGSVSAPRSI